MQSSSRVIVNTLIQYVRSGLSIIIALYTTRVILDALGAEDYGVYVLIGGVVSMLSFVQNALTQTTQRFLAFYIGKNDIENQKNIFLTSLLIQLVLSIVLIVVLVLLQEPIINGLLDIPESRLFAAKYVYYIVIGALFFTMMSVPYMAILVANENIVYYSIVNIVDSLLLIPIAWMVSHSDNDRLILYAFLMFLVKFINILLYYTYCKRKFSSSVTVNSFSLNKKTFRDMFSFSGWNTYGAAVPIVRNQGLAIVVNNFMGTVSNAAYGIGLQVFGQLGVIPSSITNAIMPQIVKSEGGGDRNRMIRLSEIASKFSFLLVGIVAIPLLFEITPILEIWLKEVPENTDLFCIILIIAIWVDQLTIGLASASQAIGRIKEYMMVVSNIKLLVLPVTYILFLMDFSLAICIIPFAVFELISSLSRIIVAKYTFDFSPKEFVKKTFLRGLIPIICTIVIIVLFVNTFCFSNRFIVTTLISLVVIASSTWLFGLEDDEKKYLKAFLLKIKNR